MRVHVCGGRGSRPATGGAFVRYGGDTSCIAIVRDDEPDSAVRLVIDAGSGLRHVDRLLAGRPFEGSILMGHLHWDHLFGLPFFRGGDRDDARTRVLLPAQDVPAIDLIDRMMSPPLFPVRLGELHGDWAAEALEAGTHRIEGFDVLAVEIPHKGGRTFGYRISDGTTSLAYLSDHGPRGVLGGGPDGGGPYHDAAMQLCADVDLVIHDAQHTAAELPERSHFGHSSAEYAVELGRRAHARQVLLFHHDPDRTDDEIDSMAAQWADSTDPVVTAARQGAVLLLGS